MTSQPSAIDPAVRAAADIDAPALAARLAALKLSEAAVPGWSGSGVAGLALSGGGIRSATLSLGMLQAVSRRGLVGHFDYVSSVSGGGYIGSFFRSLFLPAAMRGGGWHDPGADIPDDVRSQHRFAEAVLASEPADREVAGPAAGGAEDGPRLRNPIWWLRQHSRYLAPNGPSDYASAASYLIRNWIAMLYVFVIAVASIFTGVTLALRAVFHVAGLDPLVARLAAIRIPATPAVAPAPQAMDTIVHLSPWLPLAGIAVIAAFCCGLAYWMTENMRANPQPLGTLAQDDRADSRRRFLRVAIPTAVAVLVVGLAVIAYDISVLPPVRRTAGSPALWIVAGGIAFILTGILVAAAAYLKACRFANPTAEMRRLLTAWLTIANLVVMIFAAAGLCDSLALALRARVPAILSGGIGPLFSTILIPAAAFAINRLSSLLGGRAKGGGIAGFLARHMSVAMLALGILLYGAVAILVDAAVQALLWSGTAWAPPGLDGRPTVALLLILLALALLTGRARGFINLSSLHQLYAARLTRAYLGASNVARLRLGGGDRTRSITEGDPCDHIEPRAFFAGATTAPIPLMLATLNETIAPQSQLTERDRKGVPFLLGPDGISVDRGPAIGWRALAGAGAEALSMGQWCAISGASASAGMGRLTTLGGALTLTFANVRLGYWWDHGGTIAPMAAPTLTQRVGRLFDTFVFLFDEMTARYSRNWRRVYLSDGGHFENSAAYALLHRRVGVILLCDGGADLGYNFDDLEQLVRKARLDLRGEVEPVDWATVTQIAGDAAPFFLNAQGAGGWHERIADTASDGAFALLLRTRFAGEDKSSLIVWLKPRRLPTMAADVAAYARFNPEFPQQSTGDQFFDEAQWESYRKLGFQMTDALLEAAGPEFLDRLRAASGR